MHDKSASVVGVDADVGHFVHDRHLHACHGLARFVDNAAIYGIGRPLRRSGGTPLTARKRRRHKQCEQSKNAWRWRHGLSSALRELVRPQMAMFQSLANRAQHCEV
jgi:hypothetical protein